MSAARNTPFPVDSSDPQEKSVVSGTRRLLVAGLEYGEARLKLAREEGRDLLGLGVQVALAAFLVGVFLSAAYLFALLALVDWAALHWWAGNLAPAAALAAGAHLVMAGALALWASRITRGKTFFHATRREYELDKQWLRSTTSAPKSSD